jgi:acyl-CoA synthetase (AMP-forming)/AMP-acid ligase II
MSARLASVAPAVNGIKHWVLLGGSKTFSVGAGRAVIKLEELVLGSNRGLKLDDFIRKPTKEVHPALITFTSGAGIEPRGVALNEDTLLEATVAQSSLYYLGSDEERVASLLPDKSLVSIIHMAIMPLVAGCTSVALPELEASRRQSNILEELYDNQVTAVWLNETHLPDLRKATKLQRFVISDKFRAFLLPTRPVAKQEVDGMPEVIVPCYGQAEAGGIVCVGTRGHLHMCSLATRDRTQLVAAGGPLAGLQVRVVEPSGLPTKGFDVGEIVVNSKQVMEGYEGSPPGGAYLGPDGSLHTGDRGYWSFDDDSNSHLVIIGREEHFVTRGEHEVSTFELESVLKKVIGVTDVQVVAFTHTKYGKELGAFVLLAKRAQVTRESLWINLLMYFPWEVVPKVFMIAESPTVAAIPPRREIEQALARFASTDFSTRPKL